MNTHSFYRFPCFSGNFKIILFCGFLLLPFRAKAQTLIPAQSPDIFLTGAFNDIANINADVIQNVGPGSYGIAKAFVWDDPGQSTGVMFTSLYGGGAVSFVVPQGINADVALANDVNNVNNFIAGIVYLSNGKIFFDVYKVNGGTLSYTITAHQVMNTFPAYGYPHIDMFADDTIGTGPGASLMHRFVLSWTDQDPTTGIYRIRAAYGDIGSPTTYTTATIRQAPDRLYDDVAASNYIGINPHLNAYFVIENDDNDHLEFRSLNCTSGVLSAVTTLSNQQPFLPRIEAMGLDNPALSNNPWAVVAPLWNGSSYDVFVFDNLLLSSGGYDASIPVFSGWDNLHVAIAAGVGPTSAQPSSLNYYFGWAAQNGATSLFVSRGIDYFSGGVTDPNFYQINTGPVSPIMDFVPLAMTSISNTGKQLITAWYRPNGMIYYKTTYNNAGYKPSPSGIQELKGSKYAVFPNPAHNRLIIQYPGKGIYTITNISGQVLLSGKINPKQTSIDIQALSPGIYWVLLQSGNNAQHFKFIKQ